jgi:hypothetical protein
MHSRTPHGGATLPADASPNPSTDLKRRRFLLTVGAGGASAAAAVAATVPGTAAIIEAAPPVAEDASGYRETTHVRDYYRTARV